MDDTDVFGQSLDDEFTREPLDPAKVAPNPPDEDEPPAWVMGKAPRRRTIRHIVFAVGSCALLAVTVLVATGTAGQWWRQARLAWQMRNVPTLTQADITPQSSLERTLPGSWERQPEVNLPSPDVFGYIPAPNDPQTLYGCSASRRTSGPPGIEVGSLTFWYSHDVGHHWSNIPLPGTKDVYCDVAVAPDDPQRLLLTGQLYTGCSNIDAYLSPDGGAHWYAIDSLPDAPAPDDRCGFRLWPTGRHLYLGFSYLVLTGSPQNGSSMQKISFWRSDDGGKTWKQLDTNGPPGGDQHNYSYPVILGDGETLLLDLFHYDLSAKKEPIHQETQLWISHDAGESWEPWAIIQGITTYPMPTIWESTVFSPSLAHPLYLLSNAGIPSAYLRLQIAQVTDMQHWAPLPPLPIAGASPAHLGITNVLTETPSGRLLVFGLGPNDRVPASPSRDGDVSLDPKPAQQWLWEWDPQASRWTLLSPALDVPWPDGCSDHCWQSRVAPSLDSAEPGAYLWVSAYIGAENAHLETYRIPLPDSI